MARGEMKGRGGQRCRLVVQEKENRLSREVNGEKRRVSTYVRQVTRGSGDMSGESESLMRRGRMKGDGIDRYKGRGSGKRSNSVDVIRGKKLKNKGVQIDRQMDGYVSRIEGRGREGHAEKDIGQHLSAQFIHLSVIAVRDIPKAFSTSYFIMVPYCMQPPWTRGSWCLVNPKDTHHALSKNRMTLYSLYCTPIVITLRPLTRQQLYPFTTSMHPCKHRKELSNYGEFGEFGS